MAEMTPSQERALEAAREVWRQGGTKAAGVEAGMAAIRETTPAGYFPQIPGERRRPTAAAGYEPITTVEQAQVLANYLGEYGDYPVGLSPCFAAGINGDAGDACPFAGEDFCTCDTED